MLSLILLVLAIFLFIVGNTVWGFVLLGAVVALFLLRLAVVAVLLLTGRKIAQRAIDF